MVILFLARRATIVLISLPFCSLVRRIKKGRVVVILRGRYAGKKAVILATAESGQADRPYPHAIGETRH